MPKIRSFLIAFMLFTLPLMFVVAQELPQRPTIIRNYLTNGEFEAPYDDLGGVLSREVAEGWTPWSLASETEYPIFEPASINSPDRILEGEDAQKFVAFLYEELTTGVYQSVTDLERGLDYTFSVNAYVWSSNDETERDTSADPCGTTIEVGIDPTGSIDPDSEAIIWSEPDEVCDEYTEHAVTALVEADTATVFVRATAIETRVLTEVYLDEATLLQADAAEAAAQRGTEEPGGTEEADATDEIRPGGDAGIITPPGTESAAITEEAAVITEEPTPELSLTEEVPATMELQPTPEISPTEEIPLPTEDPGIAQTLDAELLGTNSALSATTQADLAAQTAAFDLAATGIILTTTQQGIDTQNTAAAVTNQAGVDADATALIATSTQSQIQTEMASTAGVIQLTNAAIAVQATEIIAQATNIIATVTAQAQLTAGAPTQTAAVIVITTTPEPATDVPTVVVLPTNTATPEPAVAEPTAAEADGTEEAVDAGEGARTIPLSEQFPGRILHTVQNGETVSYLSTLYGSTNEAIIAANGLNENALIYVGQGLLIPVRVPPIPTITPTPAVTNMPAPTDGYVVRAGDTLSQIARRYNTTVTTLAQLNGITNINSIQVGQRLQLPTGGTPASTPNAPTPVPPQTTYVVQPGDSLYIIAIRYKVTIAQLLEANQIENPNRIFVGQRLAIPQAQ